VPENRINSSGIPPQDLEKATFAGGCFWCMQALFDKVKGVVSTVAGYTGGHKKNPTYEEVCSGKTGHSEAIEILYDPSRVTYEQLLDIFWKNIEPTMLNRQFVDFGTQYRTTIFYHDEEQKRLAEVSKERLEKSGKFYKPIVTEIQPASTFYKAEEYHQQYYKKNPIRYEFYEAHSGRSQYLKTIWSSEAKK
jgi:methionine-S-sulfoxide reductase